MTEADGEAGVAGRTSAGAADAGAAEVGARQERTVIKTVSLTSVGGGGCPAAVDAKDDRIVRIRPLHYDSKYDPATFIPWKCERDGKVFRPLLESLPSPFSLAYKKRAYSPNRILYPLKRVDRGPQGAPCSTGPGGGNPQNGGKSKFVRISWDEATQIVADEIRPICDSYGPLAILLVEEANLGDIPL